MNRKNIFRVLWSRRFSTLGALIVLGLLFTAAGAKAGGCAIPYKAGAGAAPAIPFVSPHVDGEWERACHHRRFVACEFHCKLR